ncbi:MAG: universal stress protein [Acidimicrobiales bacterium]|nr:universal stress protein [Acidimicrobiales bacterium]
MARIVVGVDGSPGAHAALQWAAQEASLRRATLEVVLVWQYPPFLDVWGPPPPPRHDLEAAAQATLDRVVGAIEGVEGVEVVASLVEGSPAEVLVTAGLDADMIVVGSRGHGGFTGLLLGSVSQYCVTHARCPVVVVPSKARSAEQH